MLLTLAFSAISLFPAYPASTPAPEWPTQRMKFEKIAAKSSSSMIGTPETGTSAYRSHAIKKSGAEESKSMKSLNTLNELRMNVTYSSAWNNSGIYLPTGIYSMPVSGGEKKFRPMRPRPFVCSFANTIQPSGAPLPACSRKKVLVEDTVGRTVISSPAS